MKRTKDIAYGQHSRQVLDVYQSNSTNLTPVIIFIHGGSWRSGSKEPYGFMGVALAKAGFVMVNVNYRLYPDVTFPGFIEDIAHATSWVRGNIRNFGGDPNRIIIMGHSAGGHMAALLAHDEQYLKRVRVPFAAIKGFVGLSGAYDFYPHPDLQPIFHATSQSSPQVWRPIRNVTGTGVPTLLIQGRFDWIVKPRNASRYAAALHTKDIPVTVKHYPLEHMGTAGAFLPIVRWVFPEYRTIMRFIRKQTSIT